MTGVLDSKFGERAVVGVVKSDIAYLVFKHELNEKTIKEALILINKLIKQGDTIDTYWDKKRKGFR